MKKLIKNLSFWVLIAGILGYIFGSIFGDPSWATMKTPPNFYQIIVMIKSVFISALKMMIAPMIFFSLIGGIINIGEITKLKSMGLVTITYYVSTTIIAIMIGLTAVFFIHPWKNSGVTIKTKDTITQQKPAQFIEEGSNSIPVVIKKVFETALVNPFHALANNNILGIVNAALLLGMSLLIVHHTSNPLYQIVKDLNIVINKVLHWIINLSPIGIFAIVFDFKVKVSGDIFSELLSFALLVFGATMVHGLLVLPSIAWFFGKLNPIDLFKKTARPLLLALSTASSSATLPVTMQTCEEELGVTKGVSGFVFPLGATMNMDGTALFEGIAAIFLANLYGIELSGVAMFSIFFMAMLSSVGAPGMPSGSMSGMQMVLLAAGIPLEAIGILLVIERPLDTFRTAVNVEGDIIGAVVTQRYLDKREAT